MVLRGTNQEYSRPHNRRIVLEFIRARGSAPRSAIADGVGLTVQTVSTIVRELEELGYLLMVREKPRGRGTPPQVLRLNPDGAFAIGISVTPLGVEAGLMNLAGDMLGSAERHAAGLRPTEGFRLIGELIADMRALAGDRRILGIGLAMPGPVDVQAMSFVGPTTLEGWGNVPVRARLQEVSGLPAFLAVDTSAAATGERLYGRGANLRHFYYLHFGVGLGGVMMQDGVPIAGARGNATEIGHIPLVPGGRPCPCGNAGCLERYVSLDSFEQRAKGQSESDWVAEIAPIFRNAITTVENLFDPEAIVLGGMASQSLLDALAALGNDLPVSVAARYDRAVPRLIASTDRQSVLRGAAALAVSGVLSPGRDVISPQHADPLADGMAA
ncbi:MAG: ROK family transcriptional regulator [Candidatus Devosia phytovorans]|uniref:ROK family transcriptional regulator n=1 Tax=Candidatus Devosia phytovorans TaxID=3121372 RepID=A0AAJ5VSL9_9HYPH|nr:ROK family transcriptional regulator [Devosia sp.]WEK02912.1 MAG: ROK family transcriptional regulator [Devosia sp.]